MKTIKTSIFIFLLGFLSGCAGNYVFQDAAPVSKLNDTAATALPEKSDFDFVEYSVSSSARYPVVNAMDPRRNLRSQDVNSMDEVPESTWFTPRLGYKNISADELLRGPEQIGPPKGPLKVVKAKTMGNTPGFVVQDTRGHKYLLKFDSADFPNLQSTANLVTNRLFWGFGYNVPEDFLFLFKPEDLSIAEGSGVTQDDVDRVLTLGASADDNGFYRVTASLMIEGKVLGPIPQRGTRKGDANDTVAHQNLRILRALRVFSAWTDHSGVRSDNSLDVYKGDEGQGHTVHYILDFGEALGVHGVEKGRVWDGFEHFFSYKDTLRYYLKFGFPLKEWEKLEVAADDPKGSFESEAFQYKQWRETTQFMPIRHARAEDDYWAAKIIAAVTEEHLKTLFKAANHPDDVYVNYMIETLMKRREKVLRHVFRHVSALESKGFSGDRLSVEDRGKSLLGEQTNTRYEVRLYNKNSKKIEPAFTLESSTPNFEVTITPQMFQKANGYIRAEIIPVDNRDSANPAEFHLRQDSTGSPKLVGVVH